MARESIVNWLFFFLTLIRLSLALVCVIGNNSKKPNTKPTKHMCFNLTCKPQNVFSFTKKLTFQGKETEINQKSRKN